MSKPAKKTTTTTKKAADAAAKRESIIALCKSELVAVAKCNEALAKAGLPLMAPAEIASYDAPITAEDIIGKSVAAPVLHAHQEAAIAHVATLGKKPVPATEAVPPHVLHAHLRQVLNVTSALLKHACPEALAEYKALKHAGKRAEAYAFAVHCLVAKFPNV